MVKMASWQPAHVCDPNCAWVPHSEMIGWAVEQLFRQNGAEESRHEIMECDSSVVVEVFVVAFAFVCDS
jgi:hypothetical protein